jgi:ubiquinone/menaquinone biosynthesis C-methylase UbiE
MRALWRLLVILGFRLLYNELAWLYDPVSWLVSLGHWRQWQRTALPYLPRQGRVLEVGLGPGHLLVDLAVAGYQPVGLDLSRSMLRQARRRLRRQGLPLALCRARASALPFSAQAFDAVVLTFPAPFVYDRDWIHHLARVLRPGGRLVVVEQAWFTRRDALAEGLEWLYRITGQRGPPSNLPSLLEAAGLTTWRKSVDLDGSCTGLIVAKKGTGGPES